MSLCLTEEMVKLAFQMIEPSITYFLDTRRNVSKRHGLHIVVLDPTVSYTKGAPTRAILSEKSFYRDQWNGSHLDKNARQKALQTLRTGLPSREMQNQPQLYKQGDSLRSGSVIHNGIIAAADGQEPHFDEMWAMWAAITCQGVILHNFKLLANNVDTWTE